MSALYTALHPDIEDKEEMKRGNKFTGFRSPRKTRVQADDQFTILTFTSSEKKSGTTTTILSIASMVRIVSDYSTRVAVLDVNMRNPDVFYSTTDDRVNILNLSDVTPLDSSMLHSYRTVTESGVDCFTLLGDRLPGEGEVQKYETFLDILSKTYDMVFVNTDTYKSDDLYTILSLKKADIVICVLDCTASSIDTFSKDIPYLLKPYTEGGHDLQNKKAGVILNRVPNMLEAHQLTTKLRQHMPIVGSIPLLPPKKNPKDLLDMITHDRKTTESLYTAVQNIIQ